MEPARTYTSTEARKQFAEIFNEVVYSGKPAVITKHGGKSVAIVPYDLLALFTQLEAILDVEKAQAALDEYKREGGTTLSSLKKELGLVED